MISNDPASMAEMRSKMSWLRLDAVLGSKKGR
jgi:hypothetical protein